MFGQNAAIVANLECPITEKTQGKRYKWAKLKCPPDRQQWLNGFSLLTLGNNHVCDYGEAGAKDTLAVLTGKGILSAGYGESIPEALAPALLDIKGRILAVISLCCPTTNSEHLATHQTPGVAPLGMALLKKAVTLARQKADALVVSLHWGCEWVHDPAPDQLRLARQAIDCGADAVIGCHTHTIQSYECYRGRWIFYSLGNFLFKAGMAEAYADDGTVKRVPLTLGPANQESLAVAFCIQPDTGNGRLNLVNIQPMRFDDVLIPRPIATSLLSFDIEAANKRLANYVRLNRGKLKDRREPLFYSWIRNGVPAFRYVEESIVQPPHLYFGALLRKLVKAPWNLSKKARRVGASHILEARIEHKWRQDKRQLPLTRDHRELYFIIHRHYWYKLNDFPNLINCRDFNDRIQWLKLFDQDREIIRCSDKLLVRDYIAERVGEQYLVKLYQKHNHFNKIDFNKLPNAFVIKTNHDSGSVILVRDKENFNLKDAEAKIESALSRKYGWDKGEWAYSFIEPKIMVEQHIDPSKEAAPADYKFQCVDGQVKFCRYTYGRRIDPKEIVVNRDGIEFNFVIDENFQKGSNFELPSNWNEMLKIAETISADFKCVRVDLYSSNNKIYVGEMTFFPMEGCYKGNGQRKIGKLLDFDRSTTKPPLISELRRGGL